MFADNIIWFPHEASTTAGAVDRLLFFLTAVCGAVGLLVALLLFFAIACFVGVRMMMTAPVASIEPVGPVALIKRSWQLTAGHFWRLFGFLVLFFVAGMIVIFAIEAVVGMRLCALCTTRCPIRSSRRCARPWA